MLEEIKKELQSIPSFECIEGMLELVDVVYKGETKVKTRCPVCNNEIVMHLDLKL